MPRIPAHLRERALCMLQGGIRTADVVRAINCNVRTVRCLRQCYREIGWTADRPHSGRPHVITPAQEPELSATGVTGARWDKEIPTNQSLPNPDDANCASPHGPPGRGRLRQSIGANPGTLMAQLALQYSTLNYCATREAADTDCYFWFWPPLWSGTHY